MTSIGILGGGQLGKMIAIAAHELGFTPYVFSDNENSPATEVTKHYVIADYDDQSALLHFAESVDVITFEFENIPLKAIEILSKNSVIAPNVNTLKVAQNRVLEKNFLKENNIKITDFREIKNKKDLLNVEFPIILKTAEQGYDGKGQILIKNYEEVDNLEKFFPAVAESVVNFQKELSVIVARNKSSIVNFPIAENIHKDGILITSKVPADVSEEISQKAIDIACNIAKQLDIIGLLAVEFFLTNNNELLVNEIAPRPHNSGHWSMDCCDISQFHILCLAITSHRLKTPNLLHKCTMHNILGADVKKWLHYIHERNHKVYIYGKKEITSKRKMGHINIISEGIR